MPYTIGFLFFDLAGFYTAGLPSLAAVLNTSSLGPLSTTSTSPPLAAAFMPPPNPPDSPGTLLVTDPAGPGDFFRSGRVLEWPAEPVNVVVGTGVVRVTLAEIAAGIRTPEVIPVESWLGIVIGVFTGFMFAPRRITISRIVVSSSPERGVLPARFSGIIEFFTFFVPRRTDFTGNVDITLIPSGNADDPAAVVNARTSNLSLSPGFLSPLSTFLVPLLAPLFFDALRPKLTSLVNGLIASMVAPLRATLPMLPGGVSIFSSAATISARRITVLNSGIVVQGILSELQGGLRVARVASMAAAPLSDGRLEAWAVRDTGGLVSTWQVAPSSRADWAPWFDFLAYRPELPAPVSQVAMARLPDDRLEAWAVTTEGGLFSTWKVNTGANADWAPWFDVLAYRSLPAGVPGVQQVAMAPLPDRRLEAWAVTPNGRVFSTWKVTTDPDADWAPWFDFLAYRGLPAGVPGVRQVAMAPLTDGRLEAWAVTTDGRLFSTWKESTDPNADWVPWFDFLAYRPELPAAVRQVAMGRLSDGRIEAWAVTVDGRLFSTWKLTTDPNADWEPWFNFLVGPHALPAPAAHVTMASLSDGRLTAWVVMESGGVFITSKVSTDPDADWSPWADFLVEV
jgi:hypothetical protein